MVKVVRCDDLTDLVATAANEFIELIGSITSTSDGGVHGDGSARVVLTGGGAGIRLLESLVVSDIDWSKVHVFFGDERNVAVTDPESNEGQARSALLDHIDIPEGNIHGYNLGSVDLAEAARTYEDTLNSVAPRGFDLHLLGMGGEGHINSLFPHTRALAEQDRRVVAVFDSPKPPAERATLTMPAVNSSTQVWLLVAGAEKAEAAAAVANREPAVEWPAAGAEGTEETVLFVAADASTKL